MSEVYIPTIRLALLQKGSYREADYLGYRRDIVMQPDDWKHSYGDTYVNVRPIDFGKREGRQPYTWFNLIPITSYRDEDIVVEGIALLIGDDEEIMGIGTSNKLTLTVGMTPIFGRGDIKVDFKPRYLENKK